MEAFGEKMLAARMRPDGSLIPPEDICAFDQTPVTREIVGRTTLVKKGSKVRAKIRTAGLEKERWTLTPLLFGDGRWRKVRAIATFHGAPPPSQNATESGLHGKAKGGRRKVLRKGTVAHELRHWQANGYPAGMVYSCNKTAYFKTHEAQLTCAALRRIFSTGSSALPSTLTLCDDYSVQKMPWFSECLQQMNSVLTLVKGGMTAYCNPGDRLINKVLKAKIKTSYLVYALQQTLDPVTGKLPPPTRAQSANGRPKPWNRSQHA